MILENGIIRTLDPSLPTSRALAIASPWPGVWASTKARSRARRRSTSAVAASSPLSPTRTSTSPRGRSPSVRSSSTGCESLEEALARVGAAEWVPGRWLRGYGWRDGDWNPPTSPTKQALDEVTGETPAIFISKDYHSVWLNSAVLAHAGVVSGVGGLIAFASAGMVVGTLLLAAWGRGGSRAWVLAGSLVGTGLSVIVVRGPAFAGRGERRRPSWQGSSSRSCSSRPNRPFRAHRSPGRGTRLRAPGFRGAARSGRERGALRMAPRAARPRARVGGRARGMPPDRGRRGGSGSGASARRELAPDQKIFFPSASRSSSASRK